MTACRPARSPAIPSAGLTEDTPAGPVDLVAVARVRAGQYARLTRAEAVYLFAHLPYTYEAADLVAEALGVGRSAVLRRLSRHRAATRADRSAVTA